MLTFQRSHNHANGQTRSKSILGIEKSHIMSMNLQSKENRSPFERHSPLKEIYNGHPPKKKEEYPSQSYKKERTFVHVDQKPFHLTKCFAPSYSHSKLAYDKGHQKNLLTERLINERINFKKQEQTSRKPSVGRIKTEISHRQNNYVENNWKPEKQEETIQISHEVLTQLVKMIKESEGKKKQLLKEISFYKKQMSKENGCNSVLLALKQL